MSEWKKTRLKSLLALPLTYGLNVSSEDDRRDWPRYIRITDFDDDNNLHEDSFKSLPVSIAKNASLSEGDLLFARSGATAGKTFLYSSLPNGACYAGYLIRARFNKKVVIPRFISYYTKSTDYINWKNQYCIQTTIQNISADKYYQLPVSIPNLAAQQKIVDYLDVKTSAIDTQIELLKKKKDAYTRFKKATVSRAVTRGLNENVKLKDSGVEWIGMTPEHWKIYRFKDVYNKSNVGESIDKEYFTDNEADCFFYTAGIVPIHTDFGEFPQWKYTNRNDLLLARNGTPYVYLPILNSVYSDHIIRVDIKMGVCREFVRFCLQQAISTEVVDSVSIPTWSISVWNKQLMSFPPFAEQQAIATYLDEKCAKIDAAIANIDKQIDALKRLKRSLINEVITGKRIIA